MVSWRVQSLFFLNDLGQKVHSNWWVGLLVDEEGDDGLERPRWWRRLWEVDDHGEGSICAGEEPWLHAEETLLEEVSE